MIHVFKLNGAYKHESGVTYDCKCVSSDNAAEFLSDGWSLSLDEALSKGAKNEEKPSRTKSAKK